MLDEETGRNRSHADRPVAVIVIVLVSDRDPCCISRLRCCRYFQDCAHRVTPLIRDPRTITSVPKQSSGVGGPMFKSLVPVTRLRKPKMSKPSLSSVSQEFFAAHTYLSQTGGCFMVMARTVRPRANRGENKTQQGSSYTCALLGVRKTWFTVRRGSGCTYKNPCVSDSARCPYLVPIPRRNALCEYILTSRRECRRNCLSQIVVIRGASLSSAFTNFVPRKSRL